MFHKAFASIVFLAALINGCGGGESGGTGDAGGGVSPGITLNWPDGYSFDAATGQVTPPSEPNMATAPAYVTGITLNVFSHATAKIQEYSVPTDTLELTLSLPQGRYDFGIVITTTRPGLTFSGFEPGVLLLLGATVNLDFNLNMNMPPVIASLTSGSSRVNVGSSTSVTCAATDEDNDTLAYSFSDGGGGGSFISASANSGSVTYTVGGSGQKTITCTVSDGFGGSDSGSVTVTGNAAPVVSSVTFTGPSPGVGETTTATCNASDANGDPLSYSWSDNGAGGTFNTGGVPTGSAEYTPAASAEITITCTANDGLLSGSGSATLNSAGPQVTSITVTGSVIVGQSTTLTCDTAPWAGTPLSFTWSDNGAGGSFSSPNAQTTSYMPAAWTTNVTCTATDGVDPADGTTTLTARGWRVYGTITALLNYDIWKMTVTNGSTVTSTCSTTTGTMNVSIAVYDFNWATNDCGAAVRSANNNGAGLSETMNWTATQTGYWFAVGYQAGSYSCLFESAQPLSVTLETNEHVFTCM